MNDSSRLEKWFDTFFNKHYIIIGTRSAIFLPVNNLGLVLVYEESDPSYKESTMIRYNTLDVALRLGRILKIPVVFGSIAPSIKTRYYSENNSSIEIIKPSVSIIGKYLVEKKVVDLKVVDRFKEDINITNILYRAIKEEIEKKNKIVIFMNKRGYSSFLICKSCGNIPRCPQCNISYAYHQRDGKLVCHHCTKSETFHGFCSYCGSSNLSFQGTGIEKVESKLAQRFVNIEIYRLDSDTVKHKKTLQELIFNFKSKSPAILLGTQMIAKEIELDNATLLAVIDFDNMFYLPDFHNYERAFLLLNQLLLLIKNTDKSRFIIQAYNTQNIALQSFIVGGYNDFYTRELSNRMELSYPPFSKLINIIVSGRDESRVISDIERLEKEINKVARVDFSMLGPSRAPFYKINQFYRWHLLVKTNSALRFNMGLEKIIKDFKKDENNKIITDVDPVWIL
jgi:primosomal protein N' (replication factor Y)